MEFQPNLIYKKDIYNFDGAYLLDRNLTIKRDYDYLHTHNVFEIGFVVKGNGTFLINNQVKYFSEGDISVMYPGDFHITNSIGSNDSVWDYILIDVDTLIAENPTLFNDITHLIEPQKMCSNVFSKDRYPEIHKYARALYDDLAAEPHLFETSCKNLFSLLIINIFRSTPDNIDRMTNHKNLQSIIPAITYISGHYNENITAETLSNICLLSPTHMRRHFKSYLGMSPFEYIYKLRVTAAKSLLRSTQIPITRIAQEVGYDSQTSFNNHFKNITGTTPSEYRKKNI